MESVPQSIHLNPARTADSKWFIGIPAASAISLNFSFAGLGLSSVNNSLVPASSGNGYILDASLLAQNINKSSTLNLGISEDWIFAGFNFAGGFASINFGERVKFKSNIPEDFFDLVLEGNGGPNLGRSFDFNFALDVIHFREFGLAYSRSFLDERIRLGAKIKYLYGLSVIETEKNDLSFFTNAIDYSLLLKSDLEFNLASSFLPLEEGAEVNPNKLLMGANNGGWGIDLGASLLISDKLKISAALLDLGQIYWKENTHNYISRSPGEPFKFTGIDLNDYFIDSIDFEDSFAAFGDSLIEKFGLDSSNNSFSTGLHTDFILGAEYQLTNRSKLNALTYLSVYNKRAYPMLHLGYAFQFGRVLMAKATYTANRAGLLNLGAGLSLNAWPVQLYIVSDNAITASFGNLNHLNVQLGLNLTFGREKPDNTFRPSSGRIE